MQRIIFNILKILENREKSLTSAEAARLLGAQGIELSERTIRHYLQLLEEKGYIEGKSKRGRRLTEKGRQELNQGFVSERIGLAINRINNLSFLSDFNIDTGKGKVILNVSYVSEDKAPQALSLLAKVLDSPYAMSKMMTVTKGGHLIGNLFVPPGTTGIGTICSITLNGVFLKAGIPVLSRFGGVVEVANHEAIRFASVISYESSSLAPLEIFMKSGMTDVLGTLDSGTGKILGSFREIPEASLDDARKLNEKMRKLGFTGIIVFGRPGETLLGIPVSPDKAGMVVLGGLNPFAALEEAKIPTESRAMATLAEYEQLKPVEAFQDTLSEGGFQVHRIMKHLNGKQENKQSNYWSIFSEMQQRTL